MSCILLTAGLSERFGSPKALAKINSTTSVIEHIQQMLLQTSIDEIIIVLGADAEEIKPFLLNHEKIKVVYNKDYREGQTSSFQTGLKNISPSTKGILLLPIDCPAIKPETIDMLCQQFLKNSSKIVIPSFQNHKGHPPIFPISLKKDFLALHHSQGINIVAQKHPSGTLVYPVDDSGVVKSFNTLEEFQDIKKLLI